MEIQSSHGSQLARSANTERLQKNDHNRQNALIHHLEKKEEKPETTTRDTNVIEDPGQVIDDDMSFEEALRIFHEEE